MDEYKDRLEWIHYLNMNRKFIRLIRAYIGYKNHRLKQISATSGIPSPTLSKLLNEQENLISKKFYVKYMKEIIKIIKPKQFLREILPISILSIRIYKKKSTKLKA